jgi:hypothetical protein
MDLTKLKKPIDNTKIPIILFFNGTFAPIHDGKIINYNFIDNKKYK